jgi:hypothetical protein
MSKKVKNLSYGIAGIGLLSLSIGLLVGNFLQKDHLSGFLSGFGSVLTAFGVVSILIYERNPKLAKAREISQKDERNIRIWEKSAYISLLITIAIMSVTALVFVCLENLFACWIVVGIMLIHAASFWLVMIYQRHKM